MDIDLVRLGLLRPMPELLFRTLFYCHLDADAYFGHGEYFGVSSAAARPSGWRPRAQAGGLPREDTRGSKLLVQTFLCALPAGECG